MVAKKKTKSRTTSKKRRKSTKKSLKKFFIKSALVTFLACFGVLFAYVFYCYVTLPEMEVAFNRTRLPSTTIIAENGNEIQTFGNSFASLVYAKDLPYYVPAAIIDVEDRRFYAHFGFDVIGFTRAAFANIFQKRYAQGASTITQQVAKNLFLTSQKSVKRKVQELLISFWLEKKFTKEQILTLYLNRVYLGSGVYGIEAAANKYFGKSSRDLTLKEAAVIAGMLKAPSRYNPIYNQQNALDRANVVLKLMFDHGTITETELLAAKNEPLYDTTTYKVEGAKHFADMVYAEVNAYIGQRDQDIYVSTTLDQDLQQKAEAVLKDEIAKNAQNNVTQGAVVILDYDGAIKALVGGVDYEKNQFNRATQALRQPGSAFKTFVYLTALEKGFRPSDSVWDTPLQIGKWKPENYNKKYYGEVSLEFAFANSLNLATVDLSRQLNLNDIIKNAKKMGITTNLKKIPALVLGTCEVRVIDMANAYLTIANGGYGSFAYSIKEIYSKDGYQLYERIESEPMRVLDEKVVAQMTKMLESVVQNGTGKRAQINGFSAGKTGTSQDYRDAWFVGFTKKYVVAVWVGNDDNSPMKNITGGTLPAQIFQKIMLEN
ncbi:MAG: PBP1A family penicillin-binding protein [Alphaproteobacteria bacterium]|nr:PBP1A family penicillin-binding protein [Alphaproteobacteria bacterium]